MKDWINKEEIEELPPWEKAYWDSIDPEYQGVWYKMYYKKPTQRVNITLEDIAKDEPDMVEKLLEDIEDSEFLQDNNKL